MGLGPGAVSRGGKAGGELGHGKAAVIRRAGDGALHRMVADVAPLSGHQLRRDLDAREGPPLAQQTISHQDKPVAVAAHEGPAVDDEGQHTVGRGLLQLQIAAAGREAEPRVVDELAVLLDKLAVVVLLVVGGRVGVQLAVRQTLQKQVCAGLAGHTGAGQLDGQRGGLGTPERVVVGQGQQQKDLQAPVRAAGGVVLLGHVLLRVAVADGQHAVAVKDGPCQPPVEIAHDDALHDRQGQRLETGPDAGGVESALADAVGQAAAKRQRRAVFIEPARKLLAKLGRAVPVERRAGGVALSGKHAVEHGVILDGPGVVVILLGLDVRRAVRVPAVGDVPFIDLGHVSGGAGHIAGHPDRVERQIDEHAEQQPVAAGQVMVVDRIEPLGQIGLFGVGQRLPNALRRLQDRAGQRGHLHKELVIIVRVAPVFGALGVGAAGQTLAVDAQEVIRPAAARPEWGQRPQRAGEGFHLDRAARVGHAGVAKVQPCAALGIQRQQRVQKSVHQRRKIGLCM